MHETAVRAAVKKLLRFVTNVYFERVRVRGYRNLPSNPSYIFAGNHPSGLIDPCVIMAALPYVDVSCVAKDSLFAAPFVGFLLRVMRAVPVAHATTVCTPEERREINATFMQTCVDRLERTTDKICIFPEGTCHSTSEVKELKTGTARMALQVASTTNGATRPPIVPIGLNYTTPSGERFRGSVLLDIGKPIEISDDMIRLFDSGNAGEAAACAELTATIDRHIRGVTIAVPDWCEELDLLCERRDDIVTGSTKYDLHSRRGAEAEAAMDGTEEVSSSRNDLPSTRSPSSSSNSLLMSRRRHHRAVVTCSTDDGTRSRSFWSDYAKESSREAHTRRKLELGDGDGFLEGVAPPTALRRQAARRAFFSLSNAVGYDIFRESDETFLDSIHTMRRIYKPSGVKLSLGQYAALTRNFVAGFLRTGALTDPDFGVVWSKLAAYRVNLDELRVTDKYVSSHSVGDDVDGSRLAKMRRGAQLELARAAVTLPLASLGIVLNGPVYFAAATAGQRVGVDKDGDRSVVATMFCLGGFAGAACWYTAAAAAAAVLSGSLLLVPAATLAMLGGTGYVAANNPVQRGLRRAKGALRVLGSDDSVDRLRVERAELQELLRTVVDRYAPPDQVRWYNKPNEAPAVLVSAADLEDAAMTSMTIALRHGKRREDERAVLRFKQANDGAAGHNSKALLWLPGRNDSFFHTHILETLVRTCGYDVFALDLRRCGEAKLAADGRTPVVPDLLAHDCYDFTEYFEEIDESLRFLGDPSPLAELPGGGGGGAAAAAGGAITEAGGCGRKYDSVVCYAHSTGALIAALYGTDGLRRDSINSFVFNSPFWSWNVPFYQRMVLRSVAVMSKAEASAEAGAEASFVARAMQFDPAYQLASGGDVSAYSTKMRNNYEFPPLLKSTQELVVTAGWAAAVGRAQARLRAGELAVAGTRPTLCLYTDADEVLGAEEIDSLSDLLVPGGADGKAQPIEATGLVERRIESSEWDPSSHDVLAAPSPRRVKEALGYIQDWLAAR